MKAASQVDLSHQKSLGAGFQGGRGRQRCTGDLSPGTGRWSAAVPRMLRAAGGTDPPPAPAPERSRAWLAMLLQENTCGHLETADRFFFFFLTKGLGGKKESA